MVSEMLNIAPIQIQLLPLKTPRQEVRHGANDGYKSFLFKTN